MPTTIKFRRGTTTQNNSFTGGSGEITVDTTLDTLRVHDSSTAGGTALVNVSSSQTLTNKTISGASNTLSNIGNSSLSNSTITVSDSSTSTAIALGGTVTVIGTENEVEVGESSGKFTIGLPNNVTIAGNLTVNGTTTTVSSTNTTIADHLIELSSGLSGSNNNDLGILMERGSTGNNAFMGFDESEDKFVVGTTTATADATGNLSVTTGTLLANIEGNVTGNVTGQVSTLSNHNTGDLTEGSNLYYTVARSDSDFDKNLDSASTDKLSEGSTNLYYTDERVDDRVNALFTDGEGITSTYDDAAGTLTVAAEDATASNKGVASFSSDHFTVTSGAVTLKTDGIDDTHIDFGTGTNQVSTADLPEQTNLYYTSARADSDAKNAISVTFASGDGAAAYNASTGVITITGPSAAEVRAHISAGEGIDISSGEISGEDATSSNKGIASFSSDNFSVSSGAVTIKDGGVVTAELANDAVTGDKIADDAINSEHYTDGSIDTAHIADLQVTTAKIAADAITGAKIADDAINSEHYTDGSIDTAHIGDDQVTQAKIADDAVGADQLAANAVVDASVDASANIAVSKTALVAGTGITLSTNTLNVDAAQTGITSLLATDIKIGEDDQTKIDFETANEIHFYGNNVNLISLTNENSGDAVLTVPTADKNFTIKGTDGSSGITALDIDMALAGKATFNGDVVIGGGLTVSGTTTTVASTTVEVADAMLKLAKDQGTSADDVDFGFYGQYGVGGTQKYAGIFRDQSVSGDPFTFFDELQAEPGTTVNTGGTGYDLADIAAGGATFADDVTITGDLTISGDDLTMGTNTSGHILVADGTNYNPVAVSGDVSIAANGAVTIANGAVETAMIAGDAINGDKIADNAINSEHYTDGSIDTAHIADANVTLAKIANQAANTVIVRDANSSGVLSAKEVTDTQILIGDGTGFTAASLSGDVTMANTGAVTIANGAVETAMIANDAINGDKIADDAINSEHYTDGSIDTAHIADDQVTEAKIADDAVGQDQLKTLSTLLIKNSSGSTLKTIHGAGA